MKKKHQTKNNSKISNELFRRCFEKTKKLILKKTKKKINQKQKFQKTKTIKEKIRTKTIKKYINQ